MAYLITHILNQDLPLKGLRKVAFYTIETGNSKSNEYFLGTDNNPLGLEYIETLLLEKKIIRLQKPIKIGEDETLYCNEKGNLLIANYLDSNKGQRFLNFSVPEYEAKFSLRILAPHKSKIQEIGKSIIREYHIG